jgi:hypothetical protein
MPIDGKPTSMGLWIKGDGSGNASRVRFTDATGQTFQPDGPRITWRDWRHVEFPLNGTAAAHWGGANDGVVHYPIQLQTLFLLDSVDRAKTAGEIKIAEPTLVYEEKSGSLPP